jgi:hypothetical protein
LSLFVKQKAAGGLPAASVLLVNALFLPYTIPDTAGAAKPGIRPKEASGKSGSVHKRFL